MDPMTRVIHMRTNAPASTVVQEMGHRIEAHAPGVHEEAVRFLRRRRGNERPQPLNKHYHGYGPDEQAYFDQFMDPYMGKDYRDGRGNRYATEIISMGMENVYRNPIKFRQDDPDMFDFIWGILRGL
jgi:hypothetical protein